MAYNILPIINNILCLHKKSFSTDTLFALDGASCWDYAVKNEHDEGNCVCMFLLIYFKPEFLLGKA